MRSINYPIMLRIIQPSFPIPHFHYITLLKIHFLSHPFSSYAQIRSISVSWRKVGADDEADLSVLVYRGGNNEVGNGKCRFYTSGNIGEGGFERGLRGGGGFGGGDEISVFRRGGERSGMGGGGRSSMGREGGRLWDRDSMSGFQRGGERSGMGRGGEKGGGRELALLGDEGGRGGVRMGERENAGSRKFGPVRRGFAFSDDDEKDEEEDGDLVDNESGLSCFKEEDGERTLTLGSFSNDDLCLTETRFDQFSVSPSSMKALRVAGYEKLTVVQEATLPVILEGKDVLAKAKTGTGKNVAFLLPSIDLVCKPSPTSLGRLPPIPVLVVCPTREIASQAAAEANKLLKYHASLDVQVVGGPKKTNTEQNEMYFNPCQIIVVGTPEKIKDHIETTQGFATRLRGLKVLVIDEVDHLSEMGLLKEIETIIDAVPKQRQTLLFSATISPEVKQICHIALKKDYEYINTVQEGSEQTHTQVLQTHLVATLDNHFPLLYTLLKDHIADNVDYKVLLFCTTEMVKRLVAELLEDLKLNVKEIHSRMQSYSPQAVAEIRKSKSLILVTTDVSVRGVDYPDVSYVVQLGLPADRQQYLHRLRRTGRKGKKGQSALLLAPFEELFLSSIEDTPITKAPVPLVDPVLKKKVEKAMSRIEIKKRASAYQEWLEYYNSDKDAGNDKCRLVELANEFSQALMLDHPPAIPKMDLDMMGLNFVPGLRSK